MRLQPAHGPARRRRHLRDLLQRDPAGDTESRWPPTLSAAPPAAAPACGGALAHESVAACCCPVALLVGLFLCADLQRFLNLERPWFARLVADLAAARPCAAADLMPRPKCAW